MAPCPGCPSCRPPRRSRRRASSPPACCPPLSSFTTLLVRATALPSDAPSTSTVSGSRGAVAKPAAEDPMRGRIGGFATGGLSLRPPPPGGDTLFGSTR
eukprot:1712577-Prymnesium_polylepis.1